MTETLAPAPRRRPRIATVPNALSLMRLLAVPFFVGASLRGDLDFAFLLFVAAALSDALDGFIARRFNQRSGIGALLDPAADKFLMVSGYIVYTITPAIQHRLPHWLTFTVFIRDCLIVVFAYLLYTRTEVKRFPPSLAGKLSTIAQVTALATAIAANTALAPIAVPLMPPLFVAALVATLVSGFDYMRRVGAMVAPRVSS